jgi:hypothetical protein
METIAFIGVARSGCQLCKNLIQSGYRVVDLSSQLGLLMIPREDSRE